MNRQRKVAILEELLERIHGQVAFEEEPDASSEVQDELRLETTNGSTLPPRFTAAAAELEDEHTYARDDDPPPDRETQPPTSDERAVALALDPAHERARRTLEHQVEHALDRSDSWGAIGFASDAPRLPSIAAFPPPPRVPGLDPSSSGEGALARALVGAAEKRAIDSVPPSWREVVDGLKPRPSQKPSAPPPQLDDGPSLADAVSFLGSDEIVEPEPPSSPDPPSSESLSPTEHSAVSRAPRTVLARARVRHGAVNRFARKMNRHGRSRSVAAFAVIGIFALLVVGLIVRGSRGPGEIPSSTALAATTQAATPPAAPPTTTDPPAPTSRSTGLAAPPTDPPAPTAPIPKGEGRVMVRGPATSQVFVNGMPSGATNTWLAVPCGLKHLRLARTGMPAAGASFPQWLTGGVPLFVPCRDVTVVDAPPELSAAELRDIAAREE